MITKGFDSWRKLERCPRCGVYFFIVPVAKKFHQSGKCKKRLFGGVCHERKNH